MALVILAEVACGRRTVRLATFRGAARAVGRRLVCRQNGAAMSERCDMLAYAGAAGRCTFIMGRALTPS